MAIVRKGETSESTPLRRGFCDWCGGKTKTGQTYCCPEHRVSYNNLLARQGKRIAQRVKVWRKTRGRRGTPGEGLITEISIIGDEFLAEDRERWKRFAEEQTN